MKLDIIKPVAEIVFEGRNKVYGAYELRKSNRSTTIKALIIGALFFQYMWLLLSLLDLIPKGEDDNVVEISKSLRLNCSSKGRA
jgi:protein TonB